jgi:hypothetical protein
MSTARSDYISAHPDAASQLPALIFWLGVLSLLPIAAIFGGMIYLLMALAVILAIIVYKHPQESAGAGMLYLFACNVVLPHSARFDGITQPWEMYYWAIGLLIITSAAVARLGLGRLRAIPRSAKVFLWVASAAAIYGVTHGAAFSYVVRQFFGVLLLIIYFAIALHTGDEELLLRRIRTFGVLSAFCFFAYYIAVFGKYGFHKEIGFNGTQAGLLAIVLFIAGAERRKLSWILGGMALALVPALLFMRGDVLTFLAALPMALAIKLKSKKLRILCWVISAVVALPAIFPPAAQMAIDQISKLPGMERFIPPGIQDSDTLFERVVQLGAAIATVQAHPFLGAGIGSDIEFDSPTMGARQVAFVDSGWAYLLQKMGLVGAGAFLWFLVTMLGSLSRKSIALSACLLSVTFVAFFSQPIFFHFTMTPFVGTFAGLLFAAKHRRRVGVKSQFVAGPGFLFTLHKRFSYVLMKAASSRVQKE